MKKSNIILTTIIAILLSSPCAFSHQKVTSELSPLIKMYKAGNYTECYKKLEVLKKKDPSNALLYYYLGMSSAQLGKKDEAVENYGKAVGLAEPSSNLYRYAQKGIACAEGLPACAEEDNTGLSVEDMFIQAPFGTFSDKARGEYEKLRLENMMREINRSRDIAPSQFSDFKDFSGDANVTNAEILAAIQTLQKAGLTNYVNNEDINTSILLNNYKKNHDNKTNYSETTNLDAEYMQMLLMNSFNF